MDAVKDSFADYQTLWGGTREYIDFKYAFPDEFEHEPPRGADERRAVEEWSANPSLQTNDWPDFVRERWEQWHLKKAESLGFKITIEELYFETSYLLRMERNDRCLEMMARDPELSEAGAVRRLLLENLKEVSQRPDYFDESLQDKRVRIYAGMGITKIE